MGFWDFESKANTTRSQGDSGGFFDVAGKITGGVVNIGKNIVMGGIVNPAISAYEGNSKVLMGQGAAQTLDKVREMRDSVTKQHNDRLSKLVDINNPNDKNWDSAAVKMENDNFQQAIDSLNSQSQKATQPMLDASQKVDTQKTAADTALTAMNLMTLGLGGGTAAKGVAEAGAEQVAKSTGKQVATNIAKEVGSNAALGGGYGAAMTAEDKNATLGDYAKNIAVGGALGGVIGGVAGAGGEVVKYLKGRNAVSPMETAQATSEAAHMVDNAPQGLVINGAEDVANNAPDINPFNPAESAVKTPSGTPTQLPLQNAENALQTPLTGQQMPLSDLGRAAQMENPAMAVAPQVSKTLNPDELSTTATNSFFNKPEAKLNKPDRLQGKGYSYTEATTGKTQTGKDLTGRIVFGKDDAGNVITKDGTHLLEAYREKGIQIPEGKIKLEDGLTMNDISPSYKSMAAEITPGQDKLVAPITMTDEQVKQAVTDMGGIKTKDKIGKLKSIGATDAQMRDVIGVDSQGVKVKPMKITNQGKESVNPMDVPANIGVTANELQAPEGLGIGKIKTDVADFLDRYVPKAEQTTAQKINKAVSAGTNTINRATETLGSFGADTSQQLVKAQKLASDMKVTVRGTLQTISKQSKELVGKTQTARMEFGKKLNDALENRALGDKAFSTQAEKDIYNNAVSALDTIKAEMEKRGIKTRENYTPYQMLKDYGESPDYLSKGLVSEKTRVQSGHALPRVAESRGQLNDENILDLLPNYINGMIDHLAFTPVVKSWEEGIGKVPAYIRRNTTDFNDGIHYMNKALKDMVSKGSSSIAERGVQKVSNAYYRNTLYMNPKNTAYAQLQKLQAMADTTSAGRSAVKGLSKDLKASIIKEHGWFGDATSSQDVIQAMGQSQSKLGKAAQKIDINRISEQSAVHQPTLWGFSDEIIKSSEYKAAKAAGKSEDEAFKAAMANPQILKQAEISGNTVVNNTMFGANSAARPEILRGKGVIKKAFGMFQRFPLAESNFVKQIFTSKDSRVLDVLMSGDPRKIALGDSRNAYNQLVIRLGDAEKAIKSGAAIKGAPDLATISEQIGIAKDAVSKIDGVLKLESNISGAKRGASISAMWVASGAVATMWDGAANYGNPTHQGKTLGEEIMAQDPTLLSKINPWNKYSIESSGLTSPIIPFNQYGVNPSGLLNIIPGAGMANRVSGNAMSSNMGNWLKGK